MKLIIFLLSMLYIQSPKSANINCLMENLQKKMAILSPQKILEVTKRKLKDSDFVLQLQKDAQGNAKELFEKLGKSKKITRKGLKKALRKITDDPNIDAEKAFAELVDPKTGKLISQKKLSHYLLRKSCFSSANSGPVIANHYKQMNAFFALYSSLAMYNQYKETKKADANLMSSILLNFGLTYFKGRFMASMLDKFRPKTAFGRLQNQLLSGMPANALSALGLSAIDLTNKDEVQIQKILEELKETGQLDEVLKELGEDETFDTSEFDLAELRRALAEADIICEEEECPTIGEKTVGGVSVFLTDTAMSTPLVAVDVPIMWRISRMQCLGGKYKPLSFAMSGIYAVYGYYSLQWGMRKLVMDSTTN